MGKFIVQSWMENKQKLHEIHNVVTFITKTLNKISSQFTMFFSTFLL